MAKKKIDAHPPMPPARSRRIDLLPLDVMRLSALVAFEKKRVQDFDVTEVSVIRMSLREACEKRGLEQRTDVEPIGDGS